MGIVKVHKIRNAHRAGFVIGYMPGAWDLLHAGHVMALEEAKSKCDYLIVGLGINPHIGNLLKNKPILSFEERYALLRANRFVDAIIVYDNEYDLVEIDRWLPINIRFIGEDHRKDEKYETRGKIVYLSRKHNYSSSELRKRIMEANKQK